jgi:hypothetical protein
MKYKSKMKYKNKKGFKYIVYRIIFNNIVVYIGKTKRYTYYIDNEGKEIVKCKRWIEHISLLEKNKHHNTLLQLLYNELINKGLNIRFEIVAYCKTEASATNRELKEIHKNNTLNSSGRSILELKLIEDNFFNYFLSFFNFILDFLKNIIIILDTNQKKVVYILDN